VPFCRIEAGHLLKRVVLPLDHAREALAPVASRHTRGKIVLQIGGFRWFVLT
jgi:hypothetical protein